MKSHILAPFTVIILWLGLSSTWMAQTGSNWATDAAVAATTDGAAAVPAGPVMIDLSLPAPLGPVMTELQPAPLAAAEAATSTVAPPTAALSTTSSDETLQRLQALEARLTAALQTLEQSGGDGSPGNSLAQPPSFLMLLASVGGSAPVIGFLVMLLLALAIAAKSKPGTVRAAARGLRERVHRLTAPPADAADLTTTPTRSIYGQTITHVQPDGQPLRAGVFEENQVRAAAGLTLALGTVAFAYAFLGKVYVPIQTVTTIFFFEFLIRVTWGITRSPLGLVAGWMTQRQTPHWVSAKPKRFAWSLGLGMSLAMMIITNSGIRGPLPLAICLICLTLMWLEAVLGLCLGCEIHRLLVRWGWMQPDKDFEICSNGACTVQPQPLFAR